MKKQKSILVIIILLILTLFLLVNQKVYANNTADSIERLEYSEDFKKWLELSDEEKKNVIMPRMYDVQNTKSEYKNPLYKVKMLRASIDSKYNLKDSIPSNLVIKNQQETNLCWALATLSSLETNLALYNYKNNINLSKVYDFSERHMEYATSKSFANNVENMKGYNRQVGSGGNYLIASSYLTNNMGAILENEMPFENNENIIDIEQIQNKTISSQVYDTIEFTDYQVGENKEETMNQIKQHIQNYGSVVTSIHSSNASLGSSCYNENTAAKFCNNSITHGADHAVSIIGWDDNYSKENFSEDARPTSNGAWIVRNSWGERIEYKNLSDLKEEVFNNYKQQCIDRGWNSAQEIPNSFFIESGYIIENDIVYIPYGDKGLIYISYEDVNISKAMFGIVKASDTVDYDYIYQYDEFFPIGGISIGDLNIMLCNIFNKETSGTEYLTQVSLYAPETYTCKVYVNPNGTSKERKDLQFVQLKAGETETVNTGYHTLEFSKPIELKSDSFAVVIEIKSESVNESTIVQMESRNLRVPTWNSVTLENGKCFVATGKVETNEVNGNEVEKIEWVDLSTLENLGNNLVNGDSTIKAFTTTQIMDNSLKNIEIITPPTKTEYFEGENFDKTGMVIKANYNSKVNPYVILNSSDYSITNGNNLKAEQTNVTIIYEDKSINQTISVEKNSITALEIINPPTKTEYFEGENFDKTGMVIKANYKNGNIKEITDYTIENGTNLKNNQTNITISYGEKTVQQTITVIPNPLIEIKVTKAPNKIKYVVGQNFDKTGMIVTGTYQNEKTQEIIEYTIENGTNLTKDQSSITIKYEGKITTQAISVEEKAITGISVNKKPSKLKYIYAKEELELTGGELKIAYNDGTFENILMTSDQVSVTGFDNSQIGKNIITVTYQSHITQLEVEIIEEEKAINSNLDTIQSNIEKIQAYYYTDNSQDDYVLINVEIANILTNLTNDTMEYYYCLSTDSNKPNKDNWIKITKTQNVNNSLQFTIDSRNVPNYGEIASEDVIYLYIKEVATKGVNQSVIISKSMKLETDINLETYVNNIRKEEDTGLDNIDINLEDKTTATEELPNTGVKTIVVGIVLIIGIGVFVYIRYKCLNKYIK